MGSRAQGGSYLRPCDLKQAVAFEPLVLDEMLTTFGTGSIWCTCLPSLVVVGTTGDSVRVLVAVVLL